MSLKLTVGSNSIPLDNLTDLESGLQTELNLGIQFASYLGQAVSSLPDDLKTTSIQYSSGNQSWKLGDFGFTLSGGVSGTISVMTSGDLLTYTDALATEVQIGLDTTTNANTTKSISVPTGAAYVCVKLDVQIQGGISASYTQGIYGVSGSVNSNDTFSIAFYKRCQPSDLLKDAVSAAFEDFVFPLHAKTLSNLKAGDYLHHTFNGNLQVGLGASIGVDKVFYAGQYKADIPGTADAVAVNGSVKAEIQAGAKLAFNFDYSGTFEALLWKDSDSSGHLHLYRAKEQDTSLGLNLGVTLISDPTASATVVNSQLETFFKGLLGPLGGPFDTAVWPKVSSEISKYVGDVNSKVSGWLKPLQQGQATLDFAIKKTNQTFLLMDYSFALTAPAYASAWDAAISGRFLDALDTPNGGVSIAVGSGLEKLYDDKSSVTLNLFGKLNAAWSSELISNSSLVYAGNGVFHLIADVGRRSIYQLNHSKSEIDIYFAAQADLSTASASLGSIDLHVRLLATNDTKFANYIASFLRLVTTGPDAAAIVKAVAALANNGNATEMLHLILPQAAYSRLQSSTIEDGKPDDQAPDQTNYTAFFTACTDLKFPTVVDFSSLTYGVWGGWNIACNDSAPPPGAVPDRRSLGNTDDGVVELTHVFPDPGISHAAIGFTLQGASEFMNFCEDLKNLGQLATVELDLSSWEKFVGDLTSMIKNDVSQYFVGPTALALTRLCSGGPPSEVKGPAPGLTDTNSIAVTLTYS